MNKLFLSAFLIFISCILFSQNNLLQGYARTIKGEELVYESSEPNATVSLLVRSLDEKLSIEWETQKLPKNFKGDTAVFVFIAGIDINRQDPHVFRMFVNGMESFKINSPQDETKNQLSWKNKNMRLVYKGLSLDKYSDYMGYMYLHIPTKMLEPGKAVNLQLIGESAGSRTWFMIFKYPCKAFIDVFAENAIVRTEEGEGQQLHFSLVHLCDPQKVKIQIGDIIIKRIIPTGYSDMRVPVPVVTAPTEIPVKVTSGKKILFEKEFTLQPAVPYEIYLIHHSHVDIGYTHVQEEVEQMQWDYLKKAVALDQGINQDLPDDDRIKWNVEVMWAVDSYLEQASEDEKAALLEAVRNGSIELDAFYGNGLLALCSEEELFRMTESARNYCKQTGVPLESAMITDVPGWTWGAIPALAQSGVKYFSLGTNHFHRMGNLLETWGDKPFYWVSPSGKESILCWIHGKGYAYFHAGLNLHGTNYKRYENLILEYVNELAQSGYEYEIVPLRYNIGSDNGPIDTTISEYVREWNKKYVSPELKISTVSQTFSEFENRYGNNIPAVRGDITAYWEDGAASSAKETAINRANAERLVQAQTLWALNKAGEFPADDFTDAWKKVMLYNEHTWGAHNSISDPELDFVKHQWKVKQKFALDAEKCSKELLQDAIKTAGHACEDITVYNTSSWKRSGMVKLQTPEGRKVVFMAKDIPALGSRNFNIHKLTKERAAVIAEGNILENEYFRIVVDESSGNISAIIDKSSGINLVQDGKTVAFNQYFYVAGRSPENPLTNSNPRIELGEEGPLTASLIISSDAPGTHGLQTEIRLTAGIKQIEIINTIDKSKIYNPEGVHFAFPFNVPEGVVRVNMPFGFYRPEYDQLPGSNKNYFTLRRWVDISNQDYGITLVSSDAPLIELNEITTDAISYGWIDHIQPSDVIYSYVMNNYWETNYKASQEGKTSFRYYIIPHSRFNAAEVEKSAREITRPLIAKCGKHASIDAPFTLEDNGILLGSIMPLEENSFLIRLYNSNNHPEELNLKWKKVGVTFHLCDPAGKILNSKNNVFSPFENRFYLLEW